MPSNTDEAKRRPNLAVMRGQYRRARSNPKASFRKWRRTIASSFPYVPQAQSPERLDSRTKTRAPKRPPIVKLVTESRHLPEVLPQWQADEALRRAA
jgi:hypothetical protein